MYLRIKQWNHTGIHLFTQMCTTDLQSCQQWSFHLLQYSLQQNSINCYFFLQSAHHRSGSWCKWRIIVFKLWSDYSRNVDSLNSIDMHWYAFWSNRSICYGRSRVVTIKTVSTRMEVNWSLKSIKITISLFQMIKNVGLIGRYARNNSITLRVSPVQNPRLSMAIS